MLWASVRSSFLLVMAASFISSCQSKHKEKSVLYLASSLAPLADDIKGFARKSLVSVDLIFLSSSAITKHIEYGARCDVAILADDRYSDHLVHQGLMIRYRDLMATNSLVIAGGPGAIHASGLREAFGMMSRANKVILADPKFVPLGRYSEEALRNVDLFEVLKDRFIFAHSARHARILLEHNPHAMAILFNTDARGRRIKAIAEIDPGLHKPVRYPFLVCKDASKEAVEGIKRLFFSDGFQRSLRAQGFKDI